MSWDICADGKQHNFWVVFLTDILLRATDFIFDADLHFLNPSREKGLLSITIHHFMLTKTNKVL